VGDGRNEAEKNVKKKEKKKDGGVGNPEMDKIGTRGGA
jgi:hypothetical protein